MKIFSAEQIRQIDAYTIENEPILDINLMERASTQIANWLIKNSPKNKKINIFAGPGNNGGDALAVARLIAEKNYQTTVFLLKNKLSPSSQINLERLKKQKKVEIKPLNENLPLLNSADVIVDGLFGTGLTRPLEGFAGDVVSHINKSKATVIAIDVPSGLFCDVKTPENAQIIYADITLSFQFSKFSFLFPENEKYIGIFKILPIGLHNKIINKTSTNNYLIDTPFIKKQLKNRQKFSHKGTYGHALLVAGSYGKTGACILAAKAALRTGLGLLTTHIPQSGNIIMQISTPEAMTSLDTNENIISQIPKNESYNAIGIGPGLGLNEQTQTALLNFIASKPTKPMVLDADALNILSENKKYLGKLPQYTILTPHPKEFERLTQKAEDSFERHKIQKEFARKYQLIVVLKGAHTSIALPDGRNYFNSNGNPGMATAGSGDVLTGIILSLLAQNYEPEKAAVLSVFLHGLAGDIAAQQTSRQALIASDIIENLGKAYQKIEKK